MYKLKTIARRSSLLGVTAAFTAAAIFPAALVSANALNPLTERSLLLSSSAPGYVDTDGSGYSTANPNPAGDGVLGPGVDTPNTFAPAGSGPNGKKTGQTFSFRASSTAGIKAFTFQYCTTAAGMCQAPGNNLGDARDGVAPGDVGGRETNTDAHPNSRSDLDITGSFAKAEDELAPAAGEFQISVNGAETAVDDWTFSSDNWEDDGFTHDINDRLTGKNNLITLRSNTGTQINAGDYVEVKFVASESIFITNPGAGHFFVKINTYNDGGATAQLPNTNTNIVDGGVTVANVMTDSIHITTKVLETMAFSVGTQNRDTVVGPHGTCDPINQVNNNRLNLGNPSAEYSLETGRAWDVYSYWRLSSNSSGGATVYYSGNTLANTVGDEIDPMTDKEFSIPGTEQFGLGFVNPSVLTLGHDGVQEEWDPAFYNPDWVDSTEPYDEVDEPDGYGLAQAPNGGHKLPGSFPFITHAGQAAGAGEFTGMAAQPTGADYRDATGTIFAVDGFGAPTGAPGTAQFKFLPSSLTVPEPIASQDETVISCATAKMRYVGNIAPDTPAGVYTTKVNYLAAPQY